MAATSPPVHGKTNTALLLFVVIALGLPFITKPISPAGSRQRLVCLSLRQGRGGFRRRTVFKHLYPVDKQNKKERKAGLLHSPPSWA